jgi:hypothetical protein
VGRISQSSTWLWAFLSTLEKHFLRNMPTISEAIDEFLGEKE